MRRGDSNLHGIRDLVNEALKRYHLDKRARQELAASDWAEVVGEKAAKASRPEAIRDGILFVNCRSSAWAQELTLLKDRVIRELNQRAGGDVIKDIRFSGAGFRKPAPEQAEAEPEKPSAKDLRSIKLDDSDLARIDKAMLDVKDEQLAARIRGAMESELKLEQWKTARGWRRCEKCGDLFNDAGSVCARCAMG